MGLIIFIALLAACIVAGVGLLLVRGGSRAERDAHEDEWWI